MRKTILLTGSTDGIGFETAKNLVQQGHLVLIHGRNPNKLKQVNQALSQWGTTESYQADLSHFEEVESLAQSIRSNHTRLDVLINNAGVYKIPDTWTKYGIDARFVVNTLSPFLLTQLLLPRIPTGGRIVNLSSAAQASVDLKAFKGELGLNDMGAYAQSKLALTMWSQDLGQKLKSKEIVTVSVNPGSLLATKMVKEGFGVKGGDINKGSDILIKAALSEDFSEAYGLYFDNDSGQFASPHADASQPHKVTDLVNTIEMLLAKHSHFKLSTD